MLGIRPCHIREARDYVKEHHRHNIPLLVVNLLSRAMKKIECAVLQFAEGRYQGILTMGRLLRFSDAALMEHSTLALNYTEHAVK